MVTGEVTHQATCFTNQQLPCGKIPRLQADLKETVYAASGNVGQIQRGRAGAAEVCALGEEFTHDLDVGRGMLFGFERETGRQDGAIQIASGAATQAVAVELCALATGSGEQFVTHWIVNHGNFGTAFNAHSD